MRRRREKREWYPPNETVPEISVDALTLPCTIYLYGYTCLVNSIYAYTQSFWNILQFFPLKHRLMYIFTLCRKAS